MFLKISKNKVWDLQHLQINYLRNQVIKNSFSKVLQIFWRFCQKINYLRKQVIKILASLASPVEKLETLFGTFFTFFNTERPGGELKSPAQAPLPQGERVRGLGGCTLVALCGFSGLFFWRSPPGQRGENLLTGRHFFIAYRPRPHHPTTPTRRGFLPTKTH